MHIKQITISNFRSFRQQPEIHPFAAGANVVVGRNGSGKSNLFDAVQFVLLSPKFYTLRTEERQALLHEGSGVAAVNAFVEVVFDNSDNRLSPLGGDASAPTDEVVLRRTIGHKKDEFFLQRKRATKAEILSLLEGAGFSKSNPYFIVQQGKVNALCTMSDADRLALLKEVAGTTVYDEKKAESMVKMEENEASIAKIQEILADIQTRLDDLREEKEELAAYRKLDRDRRALEYALYDRELKRSRAALDDIEHLRLEKTEELRQLQEEGRQTTDTIRQLDATVQSKTHALRRSRTAALEEELREAISQRARLDVECSEMEDALSQKREVSRNNKKLLEGVEKEIGETKKRLENTLDPQYDKMRLTLQETQSQLEGAKTQMEALYARQGRGRQFRTRAERDAHLETQIAELTTLQKEQTESLDNHGKALEDLQSSLEKDQETADRWTKDRTALRETLEELNVSIQKEKKRRNDMADERRAKWQALEEASLKVADCREVLQKAQSDVRKSTPRATLQGLEALERRIVRDAGLERGKQYFGTVMSQLRLKNVKFRTAVEVAAQNALFHVIVDTDETAALLLKRLEEGRLGRVTFLPLNQLYVEDNIPYPSSPDVASLLDQCLDYDANVKKAMKHVFGRKLLARTVDAASTWSARSNMDAITLEGDLCSRKGALTGGYVDTASSRLRAHDELQAAHESLAKLQDAELRLNQEATTLDQSISNCMSDVQRLEAKRANLQHSLQRQEDDSSGRKKRRETIQRRAAALERDTIPAAEAQRKTTQEAIGRLREEMGTELATTLTEEERQLLGQLRTKRKKLEEELESQTQALEEVSIERERLQSHLDNNLLQKRDELSTEDTSTPKEEAFRKIRYDLDQRRLELEDVSRIVQSLETQVSNGRKADNELKTFINQKKNEVETHRTKDMEIMQKLEEAEEASHRLLNKRSMCISKRELYSRKIQELGSLPKTSELEAHAGLSIPALMKKLEEVNASLKQYSHVNKKAYDQFVNFSEQRESLLKRKEELDRGAVKVRELMDSLDRQKDEAIHRTFRGVSTHFRDVFQELVPRGAGELVMATALDEEDDDEASGASKKKSRSSKRTPRKKKRVGKDADEEHDQGDDDDDDTVADVSLYRGIGIQVRFSEVGENYLMSQLSGGQKALVALALIFAIQRCDPAPFYLFDELDQALDSTYRAAVADLIRRQAESKENPTQFICSTFRPELVASAHRCYGISHQNKVSNIHLLSKKDALHFIANLMSEEEAVGEVSTSRASSRSSSAPSASGGKKRKASSEGKDEEEKEEGKPEEMEEDVEHDMSTTTSVQTSVQTSVH